MLFKTAKIIEISQSKPDIQTQSDWKWIEKKEREVKLAQSLHGKEKQSLYMRIQGDIAKFRENKIYKKNITLNIEEER